jgi:hypothetical protein
MNHYVTVNFTIIISVVVHIRSIQVSIHWLHYFDWAMHGNSPSFWSEFFVCVIDRSVVHRIDSVINHSTRHQSKGSGLEKNESTSPIDHYVSISYLLNFFGS